MRAPEPTYADRTVHAARGGRRSSWRSHHMRRILRNPVAVAVAFAISLLAATATASAGGLPPIQ